MKDSLAIKVENLGKTYRIWQNPSDRFFGPLQNGLANVLPISSKIGQWLRTRTSRNYRDFHALQDISLEVKMGESIGIIGLNGSGKSTLLQILAGTLRPSSGSVRVNGRVAALLELGSGFNPEFTGRENLRLNAAVLGLKRQEIDEQFDAITAFADIGDFIDEPVKTYSSGMFVRLAFAVITHVSADILLIDEALTVGDVFFQQKCYGHLSRLRESGVAIVLVTHGMNDVEQFCSRAYLLHQGRLHATGPSVEVVKRFYLVNQAPAITPIVAEPTRSSVAAAKSAIISEWPGTEAFFDISSIPQVTEGTARCSGVALCNIRGEPCRVFEQGEEADFYYEYELLQPIEKPVVGLVLFNNKQVIVHGKNSMEYGTVLSSGFPAGQRLRFRQRIKLEIAVGHYTFEIGCASISQPNDAMANSLTNFELNERYRRHCHLSGLGPFEVTFRRNGRPVQLLHHGVANLAGEIKWLGGRS